jgi:hypothetical protein
MNITCPGLPANRRSARRISSSACCSLSTPPSRSITPESWKELSSRLMFQQSVLYAMAETFMPAM